MHGNSTLNWPEELKNLTYVENTRQIITWVGIVLDIEVEVVQVSKHFCTLLHIIEICSLFQLFQQAIDPLLICLRLSLYLGLREQVLPKLGNRKFAFLFCLFVLTEDIRGLRLAQICMGRLDLLSTLILELLQNLASYFGLAYMKKWIIVHREVLES